MNKFIAGIKEEKLKPCPFCGSNSILFHQPQIKPQEHFGIYCGNCGCGTMGLPDKEKVINIWNTRANN